VHLALTDSGTVVLAPFVGPSVESVEGDVIADTGGVYTLSVTKTTRRDGTETDWRGERVPVASILVANVGVRRFSTGRTVLLTALTTGALVAITEAFLGGGGATVPGGTPSGPPGGK
jgi:hypothetical protein